MDAASSGAGLVRSKLSRSFKFATSTAGPAVSSAEASPSVPLDLDTADLNMAEPTSRVNADSDGGTARPAALRPSPGRTMRCAGRTFVERLVS